MSGVKVVVRTRPTAAFAQDNISVGEDNTSLTLRMPKGENPNAQDSWHWKYNSVLHNASQETVYAEQVAPIVQSVLQGYNGTVMNYGQTGSGKTFTQIGSLESFQNRGITPRSLSEIFSYIGDHTEFESKVSVSYVEIYQDQLIDLLSTLPTSDPITEPLTLVEDKGGATYVKNLRLVPVESEEEALGMLFEGMNNRQIANHQLNRNSTRGHAIFTVHIKIKSRVDSSGVVRRCKLNLVDLAGSERLKKTATEGEQRSESMYINRSLTFLEQVVVALSSKGRSHTPYRQSKLTHLLKDSLGGNCKTLLIANIYGEVSHIEETISTLQFAARVLLVPNEPTVNTEHDPEQLLKNYAMQIADLKRELSMHNSLASRSRISYEPYSDSQRLALEEELIAFLNAPENAEEPELESVRQMKETLSVMKQLYTKQQGEIERMSKIIATGGPFGDGDGAGGDGSGAPSGDGAGGDSGDGVGDSEGTGKRGIAIGVAADGAKPAGGLVEPPAYQRDVGPDGEGSGEAAPPPTGGDEPTMGRSEAFAQYKTSEGLQQNETLLKAKRELKSVKTERTASAQKCNEMKKALDQSKKTLEQKELERKGAHNQEEEIIDEEEYALIQQVKASKNQYKQAYAAMQAATARMNELSTEVDTAREALLTSFNEWYAESFNEPAEPLRGTKVVEPAAESKDVMDDDEAFEVLQMQRVMEEDPNSLAFVRARKSVRPRKK